MSIELNHTIIACREQKESAEFFSDVLGLKPPFQFSAFWCVETDNGVSLDFLQADGKITPQHYAFLVSEEEFDAVFGRIESRGLTYWADPFRQKAAEINTNDGGRGCYFCDDNGHLLEILTRPYGSGGFTGTPEP